MASRKSRPEQRAEKIVDQSSRLGGRRRGAVLKEEVWCVAGKVAKYSLAYVNPRVCPVDHGRVLGYDNSHGSHHRHFMGNVEEVEFTSYEALADRFETEVRELWRREDEAED